MDDRVGHQLGNYRLVRKIGQGTFAEVYLAEHLYLERLAAIKVLQVQMKQDTQEQFRVEARTIARLQHPHIVQVLDFGLDDQTPYLVTEYASGGTLRSHHPKGTQLPLEQVVVYVNQIASALDYAHQQRVIHRDVKPENLLLNNRHQIVLSDFGLAVVHRTLDSLSTYEPAGTPLYMAPELIERHPCAASDQYALGILVYEWLAGEAPFRGSLYEVFSQHLHQPPRSLGERLPSLPVAVEEAVFKALAKDPQQRFACVANFASALEQACSATPPFTLRGLLEQRTQEQTISQNTPLVSASSAREQAGSSFSTPPLLIMGQQTGRGQEGKPVVVPKPMLAPQSTSKGIKSSLAQSNRQRFLRRVRAFWIDGVLSHSLHGAALITLGLQEQLDALANPWHLVLQYAATAPRVLPPGTRITDAYDAANGELLILGAPGSGKTTLLLELARDLLDRAEEDEQYLMPVVFNLSSWAAKQPRLTEWMIEELISKYQVPRKLARRWVEAEQSLPLLDGLDEVAPENRTACIATINTYREEHGLLPLVVASRSADYLEQPVRLRLSSAVTIQALTQQQVEEYLAQAGESLLALRVALHQDAALRELAETPLMLSILTLTYHGLPVEELLRGGIAPTRQQIFERYTERVLSCRGTAPSYSPQQTRGWLAWLARQMQRQNQTVFYLERLQPDWLPSSRMLQAYSWWAIRLPSMFISFLVALTISTWFLGFSAATVVPCLLLGGLVGGLLSGGSATQRPETDGGKVRRIPWRQPLQRFLIGILMGLSVGLGYGLNFGLRDGLMRGLSAGLLSLLLQVLLVKRNTAQPSLQTRPSMWTTKWQRHFRSAWLRNGLLAGLLVGLSFGLGSGMLYGLNWGLFDGLNSGLASGLSVGLLSHLLIGRSGTIQPIDRLIWSWKSLRRSLWSSRHRRTTMQVAALSGLSYGLGIGLSYGLGNSLGVGLRDGLSNGLRVGLSVGLFSELGYGLSVGLFSGLSVGLFSGLGYWLLFGLFQGVSSETIEDQYRVVPNQGIRRSAFNGVMLGLISAMICGLGSVLVVGLSIGLSNGLSVGLRDGLRIGLSNGLSIGLLTGLLIGGWACLQHYVLRVLLWRSQAIPWNYSPFLDYAAEHILLRKVGGGYIFVHRLLLEYFATLDTTATPDSARAKRERQSLPSRHLKLRYARNEIPQ